MQNIRVYEMPDCKMVSSSIGMFGEEKFESFNEWLSSQKKRLITQRLFVLGRQWFSLGLYV